MSVEVRDTIGRVTVTVEYNATTEKPEVGADVRVDSEVFPPADCLVSLANACRAVAAQIDEQVASMRAPDAGSGD